MRLYLSLLVAFLVLTNAALGGIGDVGVSEGYANLQPSSSYVAGTAQSEGLTSQTLGSQIAGNQIVSSGYSTPQGSALQPSGFQTTQTGANQLSGFQQPLSNSILGQDIQAPQMGFTQDTSLHNTEGSSLFGQNYPSAQSSYSSIPGSQSSQGTSTVGYPLAQMSSSSFGAPQMSGPYQEHFSPDDLKLSQPQAETYQPDGSLNFVSSSPPSSMLIETPSSVASSASQGAGSWYYPGSVSSRNKFYVQTASGLGTVAGCNYGGYVPLWSNIALSDNFYVYEWYPGQTSPYVRWWGWTWPGWKKGWFSGDVPGWHILCYHCRDASNYLYIYVWPGKSSAGSTGSGYAQVNAAQAQTSESLPSGAPTPPDPNAENLMLPDFNLVSQGQTQASSQDQTGYASQTFSTVFPKPTAYRCNQYYVQAWPGKLNTVGAVKCGEWLPLWSNIGRAGYYWSYEWAQGCGYPSGNFCSPEVKNFGYKGTGWCSTWFRGNKQGWHVLSYYSNDWSNYIYIYVWPSN
jgi:hypothetical protein